MKLVATPILDLRVVEPAPIGDARGFFLNLYEDRVFREAGLQAKFVRSALSYNAKRGTLRGMHYQTKPHEEAKLVRCAVGAVFDVAIDLRAGSPTFQKWHGLELSAQNRKQLYIPGGFAHGYLTLTDHVELHYELSEYYSPPHYRGVRWNDPAFGIEWPFSPVEIAERDANYALFAPQ